MVGKELQHRVGPRAMHQRWGEHTLGASFLKISYKNPAFLSQQEPKVLRWDSSSCSSAGRQPDGQDVADAQVARTRLGHYHEGGTPSRGTASREPRHPHSCAPRQSSASLPGGRSGPPRAHAAQAGASRPESLSFPAASSRTKPPSRASR